MNDCIEHKKYTLDTKGAGSINPCGCINGIRQASVAHNITALKRSVLVMNAGVLEPWTALSQTPVAIVAYDIDTTAETAATSHHVWYLAGGLKIQGDLVLPAVNEAQAKTALRAAGAELLDLHGGAL